jgi:nitrite reductase/ring-hydroxylating ferredoxin subunit
VTCPRHGSQFDVRSGERLRGPADIGLPTFPVVEDKGQVYVLVEPSPGESE